MNKTELASVQGELQDALGQSNQLITLGNQLQRGIAATIPLLISPPHSSSIILIAVMELIIATTQNSVSIPYTVRA